MACCCKSCKTKKSSTACLGRCSLPRHRCLSKETVRPGPVPSHLGWLYNAKDSPEHQLRCGWRPGHVSCSVLKLIEQHRCFKSRECTPCPSVCCSKPCSSRVLSLPVTPAPCCTKPPSALPLIRIVRHAGQYTISTKPSNMNNAPSGPYPLKYFINTDPRETDDSNAGTKVKYSVEGKFNDYNFDYTSSQASFVLDFSPPEPKCARDCSKKVICDPCSYENYQ